VGIAVTLAVYYPWAKATNRAPAESIYPANIYPDSTINPDSAVESLPVPSGPKA
jgi:NCS1 family nucleobase:cation symporter-1